MLGPIVAQVSAAIEAEDDTPVAQQARLVEIGKIRPAGRAVGRGARPAACPPGGSPDGKYPAQHPAEGGDGTGGGKDIRRLGVEREPPGEELPGRIELDDGKIDEGRPKGGLVGQHAGRPLRGSPQAGDAQEDGDGALKQNGASRLHFPWVPLGSMDALDGDQLGGEAGPP